MIEKQDVTLEKVQKTEGETSPFRRRLIKAGWVVPVVLATMTPKNVFANPSTLAPP